MSQEIWNGSRLSSLNRSELCILLNNRTKELTDAQGGGRCNEDTYTHQVLKVVEILNALVKHGQYGDHINEIIIQGK